MSPSRAAGSGIAHLYGVDSPRRTVLALDLPWSTIFRVLAAVLLVWLAREIAWLLLVMLVAVIIAVGLDPVVCWLERRRIARTFGATLVVGALAAAFIGFMALTWGSLAEQAQNLTSRLHEVIASLSNRTPAELMQLFRDANLASDLSAFAPAALGFGLTVLSAAAGAVLVIILVLYLLIEGRITYQWLRGFVPARNRARFDSTADGAAVAARGFVVGNCVTSVCAGVYTYTWLSILGVPAALLLAVIAFVFDFVPVLGFFLSLAPAAAMAATQSMTLALALIPIYLAYHGIENYLIAPRVYGGRLRLSNVAVLVAFAVGAELGGVLGAVLALPVAAVYPTIERCWFRGEAGEQIAAAHERLQRGA